MYHIAAFASQRKLSRISSCTQRCAQLTLAVAYVHETCLKALDVSSPHAHKLMHVLCLHLGKFLRFVFVNQEKKEFHKIPHVRHGACANFYGRPASIQIEKVGWFIMRCSEHKGPRFLWVFCPQA